MPALNRHAAFIDLAVAKPNGLADLGVPVGESTAVKKGKLAEFIQPRDDGKPGRRYQNLRIVAVKATEGGVDAAKLFVSCEIFGDDNAPVAANSGFEVALCAGDEVLAKFASGSVFLPYACNWYENRFVFEIAPDALARADRVNFAALPDEVRLI